MLVRVNQVAGAVLTFYGALCWLARPGCSSNTASTTKEYVMASPGTDPETLLARHTVVSLAVQALIERLLLAGVLQRRTVRSSRPAER